jgi:hypothetical protein
MGVAAVYQTSSGIGRSFGLLLTRHSASWDMSGGATSTASIQSPAFHVVAISSCGRGPTTLASDGSTTERHSTREQPGGASRRTVD